MSEDDFNGIDKNAAARRSVLGKTSPTLKQSNAGPQVLEKTDEFVTGVEIFTPDQVPKRLWSKISDALVFRNVPVIVGAGTLGMIVGEMCTSTSVGQWAFVAGGCCLG